LSDGIYHRLAEGSDGQRAAEEAPVRDGGAAVPTRVSNRRGSGFLPTHDRTRARVRLVRRGRRVRGCPSNPLETHVPVEKGAAPRRGVAPPSGFRNIRHSEIGHRGSYLRGRAPARPAHGARPLHALPGETV